MIVRVFYVGTDEYQDILGVTVVDIMPNFVFVNDSSVAQREDEGEHYLEEETGRPVWFQVRP